MFTNIYNNDNFKLDIKYAGKIDLYLKFYIRYQTKDFFGQSDFVFYEKDLLTTLKKAELCNYNLDGEFEFYDTESDGYLKIIFQSHGKLNICGKIGSSFSENYLIFKKEGDQTLLTNLIGFIKLFLCCEDDLGVNLK